MAKVDASGFRVLSLLRDRPLSSNELVPLLDEEPAAAKEVVRRLINEGLVNRLAGATRSRVLPSSPEGSSEFDDDDEPLALTFRGMLSL